MKKIEKTISARNLVSTFQWMRDNSIPAVVKTAWRTFDHNNGLYGYRNEYTSSRRLSSGNFPAMSFENWDDSYPITFLVRDQDYDLISLRIP